MADEPVAKLLPRYDKTIEFTDGSKHPIVFSLYVLALIEDQYGSIDPLVESFNGGTKGKFIRTLGEMLAFALQDTLPGITSDEILKRLGMDQLTTVSAVVQEQLVAGFQDQGTQTQPAAQPTTPTAASPGSESSISAESSSDSQSVSSGE